MKLPKSCVWWVCLTHVMFACISKKELVYFQDGHDLKEYNTQPHAITLRPGDVLNILINTLATSQLNTYSNADIQNNAQPILNGYTISEKGTTNLLVVGECEVAGKTVDEACTKITEMVGGYFQNASVKENLLTFTVTVFGEVAIPNYKI